MSIAIVKYSPQSTTGWLSSIKVVVEIDHGCHGVEIGGYEIQGSNGWKMGVESEYEINPHIDERKQVACEKECPQGKSGKKWRYDIVFLIYTRYSIGLGPIAIDMGKTGPRREYLTQLETPCKCC